MPALPTDLAALAPLPMQRKSATPLTAQVIDLLFPLHCGGCGKIGVAWCEACQAAVQTVPSPVCLRCGLPQAHEGRCATCATGTFRVSAIRAAALYAEPLSTAIHCFKYEGRADLHRPLGQLLAGYWQARRVTADLVAAVPLHADRLHERGFNQSQLLAEVLCATMRLPLLQAEILLRQRATQQQMRLNPLERHSNVQGAFAWQGPPLQGRKVLLIDDVATTGSTLEACAEALLAAGAGKIWALTVARALGHSQNSS